MRGLSVSKKIFVDYQTVDVTSLAPNDVILEIFSYLPSQDLNTCLRVSKKWQSLASDDRLWKTIFCKVFPKVSNLEAKSCFKQHFLHYNNFLRGRYSIRELPDKLHLLTSSEQEFLFFHSLNSQIYSWNAQYEVLDFKRSLNIRDPYAKNPWFIKDVIVEKDRFMVLIQEIVSKPAEKKTPHVQDKCINFYKSTIKIFKNNQSFSFIQEISFDGFITELKSTKSGRLFGITKDSLVVSSDEGLFDMISFKEAQEITILAHSHDACLLKVATYKNSYDYFTYYFIDLNTLKILKQFDGVSLIIPHEPEFFDGNIAIIQNESCYEILNFEFPIEELSKPVATIAYQKGFKFLSFTPEGKLLFTDLSKKLIIVDPKDNWKIMKEISVNLAEWFQKFLRAGIGVEDIYSLRFDEDGNIVFFSPSTNKVVILNPENEEIQMGIREEASCHVYCNEKGGRVLLHPAKRLANGMIFIDKKTPITLINLNVSQRKIVKQTADLFRMKNNNVIPPDVALARFNTFPKTVRHLIFVELSIMKFSSQSDDDCNLAKDAFLNQGSQAGSLTNAERAKAIELYLNKH